MNKKFASFLCAGKIATLPLFSQDTVHAAQNILSTDASHIAKNHSSNNELLTLKKQISDNNNLIFLPKYPAESSIPQIMNLVLPDLCDRDEVLLAIFHSKKIYNLIKNDPGLLSMSNEVTILNNFCIMDHASISKTTPLGNNQTHLPSPMQSAKAISLPVDFPLISSLAKDDTVYLHVLVAPNSQWDKATIHHAEVFEIRLLDNPLILGAFGDITEDCTSYTCG